MNMAMWVTMTGMKGEEDELQTIANNLANVNTMGFKRNRAVFEDLGYQVRRQPGAPADANTDAPAGIQMGSGTRLVATQKIFTDGSIQNTGQELDLAIVGNGFLQVEMPDGETGYTRAGQLSRNADSQLVSMQGFPLIPQITIPPEASQITIGENGVVTATLPGQAAPTQLGQLQLATFVNPVGLLSIGDNLYQETAASGPPNEGDPNSGSFGKIKQGQLEGSNVQVVEEMVNMIATQRAYEMNTKVLSAADNMLQQLANAGR